MRRYHSIDFLNGMDIITLCKFLKLAIDKDKEDRLFIQYCAMLPQMSKYILFDEFMDMMTGRNIDMRSEEDIRASINKAHGKKVV